MTKSTTTTATPSTKRTRTKAPRKRRTHFKQVPRPPVPVRALWETASSEDRERAHRLTSWILEYWLGKATKEEVATALEVTPLRVWQMSQSALAGMVCGLLKQPRRRGKGAAVPIHPDEDPKVLKKKIAKLERELEVAKDLIGLLKTLPGNQSREITAQQRDFLVSRGPRPRGRQAKRARGPTKKKSQTTPPPGGSSGGSTSTT